MRAPPAIAAQTMCGAPSTAGVSGHAGPECLSLHQDHTANAAAHLMEMTMTWTNRITIAATLLAGAIALVTYAQALSLPAHFA